MTEEQHPLDGIDDKRLVGLDARTILRYEDGTWWIWATNYGPQGRVRTPAQIDILLEVLGEHGVSITSLCLTGSGRDGPAFLEWPGLSHFTQLDFSDCYIGKNGLEKLLSCGHIEQLTHLGLSGCDIGKTGVTMLKQSDHMPALRSLDLSTGDHDRSKWNSNMLRHLTGLTKKKPHGATLRGLETLKLGRWECEFGLDGLADSDLGHGLRVLDLEGQMRLGHNARKLLHDLARSGGQLEELRLRLVFRNLLLGADDWNVIDFTDDPLVPLKTLRSLVFDDCSFRAEHIAALSDAWFWPQLERLSLVDCNLYPGTLKPWAGASAGLRVLGLDNNEHLGREDLHELAGYPMATKLEKLGLKKTASAEDLEGLPDQITKAVQAAGGL